MEFKCPVTIELNTWYKGNNQPDDYVIFRDTKNISWFSKGRLFTTYVGDVTHIFEKFYLDAVKVSNEEVEQFMILQKILYGSD